MSPHPRLCWLDMCSSLCHICEFYQKNVSFLPVGNHQKNPINFQNSLLEHFLISCIFPYYFFCWLWSQTNFLVFPILSPQPPWHNPQLYASNVVYCISPFSHPCPPFLFKNHSQILVVWYLCTPIYPQYYYPSHKTKLFLPF